MSAPANIQTLGRLLANIELPLRRGRSFPGRLASSACAGGFVLLKIHA